MSQINSNFINYTKNGGDPTDRYELGGKIGEGGYGFVCEAYDKIRNENVAIKIIDLESAGDEVQDVHREIAVMSNLHCPQLIQYYASYVIGSKLWIVMEYLEAGSLLDIIKEFGPLQENDVAFIIRELLLALQYLHGERKIHRDVKASNLLVGRDGSIKLADLGVAGQLTESVDKRQTKIGTPFWMAPEVIMESKYDGGADIWSTGITAIELATGLPPYAQKIHPIRVILLIPRNPPPVLEGDFSPEFKDFVAKCLVKDPSQRPTATQMLAHPFVANAIKPEHWTNFVVSEIMPTRDIHERSETPPMFGRVGSNDSNISSWTFSQRTPSNASKTKSGRNLNASTPTHQQIGVRTPRRADSNSLLIDDDGLPEGMGSPRTPRPSGLMSPGLNRQRSSPRVSLNDDFPPISRSRRNSANSDQLSNSLPGSVHHIDHELTPPIRSVNSLRLNDPGLPPVRIPEVINDPSAALRPDLHSSLSGSSSRDYDGSLIDSNSVIQSQQQSSSSQVQVHGQGNAPTPPSLQHPVFNQVSMSNSQSHPYLQSNSQMGIGLMSSLSGIGSNSSSFQYAQSVSNYGSSSNIFAIGSNSSSAYPLQTNQPFQAQPPSRQQSFQQPNEIPSPSKRTSFQLAPVPSFSNNNGNSENNNSNTQVSYISAQEFHSYFQTWKNKEDYYITEISRLKEELIRLKSITKPFLSTVSVLMKNQPEEVIEELLNKEMSLSALTGGNPVLANSLNATAGNLPGNNSNQKSANNTGQSTQSSNEHRLLRSAASFRDIQSILSISSDDTTPGNSRSLSPVAVVRDDIFADFNSQHNRELSQQNVHDPLFFSSSTTANSSYQNLKSNEVLTGGGSGPNDGISLRKSMLQELPPLPPNYNPGSADNPNNPKKGKEKSSRDDSDDDHSLLSENMHLLKSEETIPYPLPVIERGNYADDRRLHHQLSTESQTEIQIQSRGVAPAAGGGGGGEGGHQPSPSQEGSSLYPSLQAQLPPGRPVLTIDTKPSLTPSHLQMDMNEVDMRMKSMLKTPKSSVYDISSFLNTHRKLLETLIENNMKSNEQQATVHTKLMENIIKPTLQEIKTRIDTNHYTPELSPSNSPTDKKKGEGTGGDEGKGPAEDITTGGGGGGEQDKEKAVQQAAAALLSKNPLLQREMEMKKQQLENVWLLFATGFSALETIMNGNYQIHNHNASVTNLLANMGKSTGAAGSSSNQQGGATVGGGGGGLDFKAMAAAQQHSQNNNILADFTSLMTSFTLEELDKEV